MATLKLALFLMALCSFNMHGVLLDKIVAIVDHKTYTLSQIRRIIENIEARKQISPLIYKEHLSLKTKDIVTLMIHQFIMREHLRNQGFVVSNTQVERQIQQTERRLGLQREALLNFLRNNNMTFDEYFELTRESIEYNIFQERVIIPLLSVTDQEIKAEYYKKNVGVKTLSFNLHIIDFSIPRSALSQKDLKRFPTVLKSFQETGHLPDKFAEVQADDLGEIKEDGLNTSIRNIVKDVQEGEFSPPLLMSGFYHVFFIKKKDLTESDDFLRVKNILKTELLMKKAEAVQSLWFNGQMGKHHVKYLL